MFCKWCGNELKDGWKICPQCGRRLAVSKNIGEVADRSTGEAMAENTGETGKDAKEANEKEGKESLLRDLGKTLVDEKDLEELKGFKRLAIYLFREHPVRAVICVPLGIYTAYVMFKYILAIFSWTNISDAISDSLYYCLIFWFCEMGLWLLYGPINYKMVKEVVTNKPQKYGILSKAASIVVIFLLMSCTGDTQEPADYVNGGGNTARNIQYIETTVDEIMRYPDSAEGKYVCIRGRAWVTFGVIGVWDENTESNIIGVETDYEELPEPKPMHGDVIEIYGQIIRDKYTDKPEIVPQRINILEMSGAANQ